MTTVTPPKHRHPLMNAMKCILGTLGTVTHLDLDHAVRQMQTMQNMHSNYA